MAHNRKNKGFTLIEMIIALGVFSVVVTAATNLFTAGLKGQRKSLALQYLQNDARYALELMNKEIRMSHIGANSTEDVLHITTYKPSGMEVVSYFLDNGKIARNGESLTSDRINVNRLKFYIKNQSTPPSLVTIILDINGKGTDIEQQTTMNFQTTISTRDYIGN